MKYQISKFNTCPYEFLDEIISKYLTLLAWTGVLDVLFCLY